MESWIDDYDLYTNPYQSALDLIIEETKSAPSRGFVCALKRNDLIFVSTVQNGEMYLLGFQNSLIDKAIQVRIPVIQNSPTNVPFIGNVSSFFCIPIQNRERVLGVICICNGQYSIQDYKRYKNILLLLRLEMEKLESHGTEDTKSKDLFVANMSHEIRTPLNGIIGYTQLLLQTRATDVQQQYISSINRCSLTLAQIVNNIIDFSKLSSGKVKMNNCIMSLQDTINFVVETLAPRNSEKKHSISVNISPSIKEYITSDRQKIIQVLMNLLSNSMKFTDANGTIEISALNLHSGYIKISVKDNGVGIPRENQNKLFRSFSQIDNTLTKSYDGAGLGLSISKKLVELMKGEIGFKSTIGIGSEFFFTFKYLNVDESKCKVKEKYLGSSVLVINSETEKRILLCDLLTKIGLKPISACSQTEAMHFLKSYTYDFEMCVLLDGNKIPKHEILEEFPLLPIVSLPQGSWDLIKIVEKIDKSFTESRYIKKKDTLRMNKNMKILIVEDNPDNQEVLVGMLKSLNYSNISIANDGLDAIQTIQERKDLDIVLLDLKMPRADGFQVLEYMRRISSPIKVIPITASVMDEDQKKCESYGVMNFLRKPIDIKDLQQALLLNSSV